ncbi:putative RNA-binding protein 18 isoform X1 [Canna indica]|uniref:RNA-binding protein 18 isoform X1 n=1 Tax=Canna indica TaxID=4628 RepID=A0AAQ3QEN6_9LILI|nr:putative RNA-binding protein 18 isoform X1 [Canna indica]
MTENGCMIDEKSESRIYIGNIDQRVTESNVIKMFAPFGMILSEDFLWHTRGPKRGEPRGYAFIQYNSKEEALRAKAKMNGKFISGRPLVVRLASEKQLCNTENESKIACDAKKSNMACSTSRQVNRNAKIAAIKSKLKALEEDWHQET